MGDNFVGAPIDASKPLGGGVRDAGITHEKMDGGSKKGKEGCNDNSGGGDDGEQGDCRV